MMTDSNERAKLKVNKGSTAALGVTMCNEGINFAIAVEDGVKCSLVIFQTGSKEAILTVDFKEEDKIGSIYSVLITNLQDSRYEYTYMLDHKNYLDPYARQVIGREVWGQAVEDAKVRAAVDFEEYDWEGDKPLRIPFYEAVMYSLHVRGFTMHSSCKVRKKGTFEGILEKLPYLKELGINQVELMPAYEFDEIIPRQDNRMEYKKFDSDRHYAINYWGYTRGNYFAPKASYAYGNNCVVAFKDMVKALHKNKIEVIMEFYFQENENQNMIIDCIRYWVEEYHIDGVHINSNAAPLTAIASLPRLSHTKIMAEHFEFDKIYGSGKFPKFKNLAIYHDGYLVDARRFLKGDEEQLEHIAYRMRRNPKQCGVINYIASHNGFNLMDLVSYNAKHNEENGENNRDGSNYNYSWNCGVEGQTRRKGIVELRKKQIKNALLMLLLSQGVPSILSGDEIANSQKGNNNPYCQDNDIAWLNWNGEKQHKDILNFTKMLIHFRKNHPILHYETELKIMDYLSCGYPDLSYHGEKAWYPDFENYNRQIGVMYCGQYAKTSKGKEDDYIYIAYNMHWIEHEFALPNLPMKKKWKVIIDTSKNTEDEQKTVYRNIKVNERSIVVLVGK